MIVGSDAEEKNEERILLRILVENKDSSKHPMNLSGTSTTSKCFPCSSLSLRRWKKRKTDG